MRANWKYLVQERISVFRGQNFTAIFTLPDTHMLSMVIDFFHAIFWLCMTTTARKESTFCHRLHYIHSLESCIIDDYIWFSWSDYEYQIDFQGNGILLRNLLWPTVRKVYCYYNYTIHITKRVSYERLFHLIFWVFLGQFFDIQ